MLALPGFAMAVSFIMMPIMTKRLFAVPALILVPRVLDGAMRSDCEGDGA
jgi:Mg2+/citrate symporter